VLAAAALVLAGSVALPGVVVRISDLTDACTSFAGDPPLPASCDQTATHSVTRIAALLWLAVPGVLVLAGGMGMFAATARRPVASALAALLMAGGTVGVWAGMSVAFVMAGGATALLVLAAVRIHRGEATPGSPA